MSRKIKKVADSFKTGQQIEGHFNNTINSDWLESSALSLYKTKTCVVRF